jgi:hypothetical protein
MYAIDLIDRSFNKENASEYILCIQANQNGISYCVYDDKTQRYILFREHRFEDIKITDDLIENISDVLAKDDTLALPFLSVRFLGYTQQSTLVPLVYFDLEDRLDYLSYHHGGEVDDEIFSNIISPLGVHNIFAFHRELASLISISFKNVEFFSQATPFLRHIAHDKGGWSRPVVYVGLNTGFFDLAVAGDDKLKLYNTFQYASESDILYYVMFVYKQLDLDTQKVPLQISGEQSSKRSYYNMLKQYIPVTGYARADGIPTLASGLYQLNTIKFLNLLNLKTCELSAEPLEAEK